jgi:hypothetical protein
VSLSNVRIPLLWNPEAVIHDVGDRRQFALFIIVSSGTQVYDSSLAYPVDCQTTDLVLSDVFLMPNVTPDFQIKVDLYSYCLQSPVESASRSLFNTIRTKLQGKKYKEKPMQACPEFLHTATAVLTINDAKRSERCHQLTVIQQDSAHSKQVLQLFDHFSCRLAVKPYCSDSPQHSGRLSLAWPGSDIVMTGCEARLINWHLQIWTTGTQRRTAGKPWLEIALTGDSRVGLESGGRLAFSIVNTTADTSDQTEFICGSQEELEAWTSAINSSVSDYVSWQQAARTATEIFSPSRSEPRPSVRRSQLQKTTSRLLQFYNRISAVNIAQV